MTAIRYQYAVLVLVIAGLLQLAGCDQEGAYYGYTTGNEEQREQQPTVGEVALSELPALGIVPNPALVTATITNSGVQLQPPGIPPGTVRVRAVNRTNQIQTLAVQGSGIAEVTPPIAVGGSRALLLYGLHPGDYVVTAPLLAMENAAVFKVRRRGQPALPPQMANTVFVHIANNGGARLLPSRIPPGPVKLDISNLSPESKVISVSGPGGVSLSTYPLQPQGGGTALTIPDAQVGTYVVTISGPPTMPTVVRKLTLTVAQGARPTGTSEQTGPMHMVDVMVMNDKVMVTPNRITPGVVTLMIMNRSGKTQDIAPIGPRGSTLIGVELEPGESAQLRIYRTLEGQVYPIAAAPKGTPVLAGSIGVLGITNRYGHFQPEVHVESGGATEEAGER